MYEVELKVRADHGPVRERLAELGAERLRAIRQVDTYYDAPDRSFGETDEALRIRREEPLEDGGRDPEDDGDDRDRDRTPDGDDDRDPDAGERTVLTYKGPKVEAESKTREEVETPVVDEEMATVLDRLGYRAVATVEKERVVHAVDGYEVTLDSVSGLGEFVEVETEAPEDGIEPAREGASAVLERLGLDPDGGITASYLGLLLTAADEPEAAEPETADEPEAAEPESADESEADQPGADQPGE